ncbi:MAG: hypothetical protein K8S97_02620 [Anaerolineae bacterium]|nr:hypothetical protein [Anaerolineae bacterium]
MSEEAYTEYERGRGWFYRELVRLNMTLHILRHINAFPFRTFEIYRPLFFQMVTWNLMDSALLAITRLMTDKGDKHTLPRFKNRLQREWIKEEHHQDLVARLRKTKSNAEIRGLLKKARCARDACVAHLAQDFIEGKTQLDRLNLDDLFRLQDELNKFYTIITLKDSIGVVFLPPEYYPKGGDSKPASDIDKILDSVARDSFIVNMPEQNPIRWKHKREKLSSEDLELINAYRRKFGLPEA